MYSGEAAPFSGTPKSCMAYPPWIAMFSAVVVVVGLCIFAPSGIRGVAHINDGLAGIGVSYDQRDVPRKVIVATAIVCGSLMAVLLLISIWRSVLESQRDKHGYVASAGAYLASNAFFNFLFWCTIIWALLAFGVCVTATAGSYATDRGLRAAVDVIKDKLLLVRDTLDSARDFIALAEADAALSRSATLSSKVRDLKKLIGTVDSSNTTGTCPYYCLDLSSLKFLSGTACVCGTDKLDQTRAAARKAIKELVPALGGLLVAFVGSTWLLMNVVAQFSHTKADARWSRRIDTLIAKAPRDAPAGAQYAQHHYAPQHNVQFMAN
jgi:hypothetical protein